MPKIDQARARIRYRIHYADRLLVAGFGAQLHILNGFWWTFVPGAGFDVTPTYDVLAYFGPAWVVGALFFVSGAAVIYTQLVLSPKRLRLFALYVLLAVACAMFASVTWANWASGATPIYGAQVVTVWWSIFLEYAHDG